MWRPQQLRYYVYVSDAKVDMLYAQIPARLRSRIAAELKIDLKVISASLSSKDREENRFSKLALVGCFIRKHMELGSIDEPQSYFSGSLRMRWGPAYNGQIVYFGGVTDRTVLGLAGSRRHVITSTGDSAVPEGGMSGAPDLIALLRNADPNIIASAESVQPPALGDQLGEREARAIYSASVGMQGSVQELEFIAKRLATRRADPESRTDANAYDRAKTILLGTPLYVAQSD
jgi:hypothetical protein